MKKNTISTPVKIFGGIAIIATLIIIGLIIIPRNNKKSDEGTFIYEQNSNNTIITGYTGNKKEIVIPEGVVKVTEKAFASKGLTKVELPSTIKEIGTSAFLNNSLTAINLRNVEKIGDTAFKDNKIEAITIPNSVESIGNLAFKGNKISKLTLPNSPKDTLYISNQFNDNQLPEDKAFIYERIGNGAENKSKLVGYAGAKRSDIVVPSNVTMISGAFEGNQITSVTLPEGLSGIGANSFSNNLLTSITIPSTVTYIGANAFANNKLKEIEFKKLSNIDELQAAFNNNQMPDDKAFIYDPNDNTKIVSYAGAKRSDVIIPEGVKSIGDAAFSDCSLTSITIPNGVEEIGSIAFANNLLTNIDIPTSVKTIRFAAFTNNQLPTNKAFIYDPQDNTKLISYAGAERNNVVIPNNVKTIVGNALSYANIKNLVISEGVETIETSAFSGNPIETVSIPSTVTKIGAQAFSLDPINANIHTIKTVKISGDKDRFKDTWENIGFPSSVNPTN